jgi:hypothetical protein
MRTALFIVLTLASSAAFADEGKKDASAPEKLICRTEADLGTRLSGTRVCLTREQWTERRRQSREATERSQTGHVDRGNGG